MTDDLLYLKLKNDIMSKIFKGYYQDGAAIPSERDLTAEYGMSRATVRRALELLEGDGIIRRRIGAGTVVSLKQQSHRGNMDIIALVAPAQRRFFAVFIDYFQRIADANNSLVVFIQQSQHEAIHDTLFRLLQNNIHNVVIWLDHKTIPAQIIMRLRGLGMNIVFFDIVRESPYADCVCLDNRDAIISLYKYASEKKKGGVAYVGRENADPSSFQERQSVFEEISRLGMIWSFPWDFKNELNNSVDRFIFDYFCRQHKPGSVICSDGELGIALKKSLIQNEIDDILMVCVDDFPECAEFNMTAYRQPYERFAQKIFNCLFEQNYSTQTWKAHMYREKGEIVIRN